MRYAWHMKAAYFGDRPHSLKDEVVEGLLHLLRDWDRRAAQRVSHFVAISRTVQQRIRDCYGRSSSVIYPPVDTDFYSLAPVEREDYYLVVSAFAPYKRVDLAVEACERLGRLLVIIGCGQDEKRLRALASPRVRFLGWQPNAIIREHFRRCRALLFPGEEDFGIVPLEAMACGAPVVAFGRGGATETVIPPGGRSTPTGMWFQEQTVDALAEALLDLERHLGDYSPIVARRRAQRFGVRRFSEEIGSYLEDVMRPSAIPFHKAA
jgi:glycosyltransferase involved in cell wall biosynthesis